MPFTFAGLFVGMAAAFGGSARHERQMLQRARKIAKYDFLIHQSGEPKFIVETKFTAVPSQKPWLATTLLVNLIPIRHRELVEGDLIESWPKLVREEGVHKAHWIAFVRVLSSATYVWRDVIIQVIDIILRLKG